MGQHVLYQFTRTRQILKGTLEGLSPELLDVIPEGFNNNIHWQVGHILKTAEFFLFTGVETLPENYLVLAQNQPNGQQMFLRLKLYWNN